MTGHAGDAFAPRHAPAPPLAAAPLVNVQVLRAFAALLVVVYHLKDLVTVVGLGADNLAFAALGVDLFFVVSGFVMVYTTDSKPVGAGRFFGNRVARVVPLYWLFTLVVFAIALAMPRLLSHTSASPADLLRSLFFLPYARADGSVMPVLFVGWSLNYEMFFYAVFALALALRPGRQHVWLAAAAITALVIVGMVAPPRHASLLAFYVNPKMLEFVAGMAIARLFPVRPRSQAGGVLAAALGVAWLAVTPLLLHGTPSTLSACGACSVILIGALSAERAGAVARWPVAILLGDASYSLYLIHPLLTVPMISLWRRWMPGGAPSAAITILVVLGITCVAAVLCHKLVELPLSRQARRLLSVRRQPIPAGGL